jgi:4-aminobutyrate aminotransferase
LRGLREVCDRHGILLILDEVQSGFGRTGRWFAFEHFDVLPDIMTVAKGIASGLPLSGVFSRLELMNKWTPGTHGGTYGGNAVAAAAAVETIRIIREENLLENAQERGIQLVDGLRHLQEDYPTIGDVRGLGLMVGAEFRTPNRQPDKATAKAVVHECLDQKFLLLTCGPWDNTIRWIPPLVVTKEQIGQALGILSQSLKRVIG